MVVTAPLPTEAGMQDKKPIRSHRGYEPAAYGQRVPSPKSLKPNFTGTGLRVDLAGCGMGDGAGYMGNSEYANDLDGRVSR